MIKSGGLVGGCPITVAASGLTTAQWKPDDGINTKIGCDSLLRIVILKMDFWWTGLAGGDGTSNCVVTANQGELLSVCQAELSKLVMRKTGTTAADNFTLFSGAAPADGGFTLWASFPTAGLGGLPMPMGSLVQIKLINGGTAYTGGNVYINSLEGFIYDVAAAT